MRIMLMVAVLAATTLAGCTGGDGLASHVVQRGDLGAGFSYYKIPPEDQDNGAPQSNPGPVTGDALEDVEGAVAGYVAAYAYEGVDGPALVSQAIRFTNQTVAAENAAAEACGFGHYVLSGAVVTFVAAFSFNQDDETASYLEEQAASAAASVAQRTGGINVCAEAMQ